MKLNGLTSLYRGMKDQNIDRYRFEYRHGKALFDVFFFIDEEPFILLFGAKGENFCFELKVENGFKINYKLEKRDYRELCRVLQLKYNPENPFSPKAFFEQFNSCIPGRAVASSQAKSYEIAQYRKIVEEEDKVYFLGWRNNHIRGDSVRQENLQKTRDLLGFKYYKRCMKKNISSRWTDDQRKAKRITLPD